jgi:hypothetical protein
VADDVRKLLDYIVDHYVVRDEVKSIDLDAPPREPADVIEADKRDVTRREQERADALGDAFAHGLGRAHQRAGIGGHELVLDDRKPEENRMADALIRFLVSHDLATSRTEETEPLQYTYYVQVDWERLGAIAHDAGIDLDRALSKYQS